MGGIYKLKLNAKGAKNRLKEIEKGIYKIQQQQQQETLLKQKRELHTSVITCLRAIKRAIGKQQGLLLLIYY